MENAGHVLHVMMKKKYPVIIKGKGLIMEAEDGKTYIDASGGPILASLGYGLEEMGDVLKNQSDLIGFSYRLYSTTSVLEEACNAIYDISGGHLDKTFLVSGGTEAVEIAIKIARTYHIDKGNHGKYKIIGRWHSYHGMSNGALAWGGNISRRKNYLPYLLDMGHIPPAYCYRCWFDKKPETCHLECAEALEKEIQMQDPSTVAAFIMEPISGNSLAGAYPQNTGYYRKIREICDKYDVLLIMDEVMTGIGRTGEWFAFQKFGVKPDIVAMGKALSGGYFPVGAASCSKKVSDTIYNGSGVFFAGYSWAGNPLAAATILKTIDYKKQNNLLENVKNMGAYFVEKLILLQEKHHTIGDIRGQGLLIGVEFVKDKKTKECFPTEAHFYAKIVAECEENGMFVQSGSGNVDGKIGDMILFGPAFIVSKDEIDEIIRIFDISIGAVEQRIGVE